MLQFWLKQGEDPNADKTREVGLVNIMQALEKSRKN